MPHAVTVVRLRRRLVEDPYSGELTRGGWDSPDRLVLRGCVLWPMDPAEAPQLSRDVVEQSVHCSVPAGADVGPADRVETSDGRVWEVQGLRRDWLNPFTGTYRSTVRLQVVEEF